MKIGELLVELGFKADTMKLKEFTAAIGELNLSSIMAALGMGAVYQAVNKIMSVADEAAMGVYRFSTETGLSSKKMEQWSSAAEQMGIEGDVVANSIKGIQSKLTGLKMGTDSSLLAPFSILNKVGAGITGQESPWEIFDKIAGSIGKLSPEIRRLVVEQMGLDDSILLVLNDWQRFNRLAADSPVISELSIQRMREFHEINKKLGQELKNLWIDIATIIEPVVGFIEKLFTLFVRIIGLRDNLGKTTEDVINSSYIGRVLKGGGINLGESLGKGLGAIGDWARGDNILNGILNPLGFGMPAPAVAMPQASGSRSVTNNNNFKIYSNDPEEAAIKVGEALRRMHSDAEYQSPAENH